MDDWISVSKGSRQLNALNFNRQLYDLGEHTGENLFTGIYSPIYTDQDVKAYMSPHYEEMENARKQAMSFDLTEYYQFHLDRNLNKIKLINRYNQCNILEICCGFGSATIPLLDLFPNSQVVASELSSSMLYVLKEKMENHPSRGRLKLLQLNAEDLDFKAESFDLICGAASLHHLFDPSIALKQMHKILKIGGGAIFFEPFENGMSILGLAYRQIINNPEFKSLPTKSQNYFNYTLQVWQKMKIKDKTDAYFKGQDDKWLFTQSYFMELAAKINYSKCIIYTLNKSQTPFLSQFKTHTSGNGISELPGWVIEIVSSYDEFFSDDAKCDFLTEGCVIFIK